jgi:hypothetical protein
MPSGTVLPSSSRPSHMKRYLRSPTSWRSSTRRLTSVPSVSMIENDTSAASERSNPTRVASRTRSPLGEMSRG